MANIINDKLSYFLVLTRQGLSLNHCFVNLSKKNALNLRSIYEIGVKLLELLEIVHSTGLVHNDLNFEKFVLRKYEVPKFEPYRDRSLNCINRLNLQCVDITYMTPYVDPKSKKHLKHEKVEDILSTDNEF